MTWLRPLPLKFALTVVGWGLLTAGCSSSSDPARFIPAKNLAEEALKQSMEAWKNGVPQGPVPNTTPQVHCVDVNRKPGQTLAGYRILGETSGPTGRTYVVELTLKTPEVTERAKYVVVGIDPLWVFRHEDYELLSHWEHHMPEPAPADPSSKATPASADAAIKGPATP